MDIAQKYINGLKRAYYNNNGAQQWDNFEKVIHGASKEDLDRLRFLYPEIPDSLVRLLEYVDGTYWRNYQGKEDSDHGGRKTYVRKAPSGTGRRHDAR